MNPLHTYFLNLCKDYRQCLNEIIHRADSNAIHNIRINIKKIRAILHLLASADSDFDFDAHFEPFRSIFKTAGKLRDLDITIKMVQKIDSDHWKSDLKNIIQILHDKRKAQVADVKLLASRVLADENNVDETAERILQHEVRYEVVKNFLTKTLSEVKREANKHISNERLHGIRKLYKDYIYDSQGAMLDKQKDTAKKYRNIDKVQKQIGDWHDYVIACDILNDFSKEEKGVNKILKEFKKEKAKMKKLILNKL